MEPITAHHIIEAVGWLAAVLKLATFSMNSMIPAADPRDGVVCLLHHL